MTEKPKQTLVDVGTELTGTIKSNVPIVVMGKVEGEVSGPTIRVVAGGSIAGKIKVGDLTSEGEVAGDIEAETVTLSGRVKDKTVIRARTMQVSLASEKGMQVVFGDCELAIGDEPNKAAAVSGAGPQRPAIPRPTVDAKPVT
jgi:cytoskeletal protein CcmA (bactofilin family)